MRSEASVKINTVIRSLGFAAIQQIKGDWLQQFRSLYCNVICSVSKSVAAKLQ